MKLIKLDAIDSTNSFLKGLFNEQILENFTVVTAENQTKGRGQMGAVWNSEPGKNLIMSILVFDFIEDLRQLYDINIAVSVSVIQVLEEMNIPELYIKWPNDILSCNKKIGGILIENSIKSDGKIHSIIGLGLNVNQTQFENLPKASSMALICNTIFDKYRILQAIVQQLEENIQIWNSNRDSFWKFYNDKLFRKGIPMPFRNSKQEIVMGIIQGISEFGKLQIVFEDDSVAELDIKELEMLY